MGRLIRDSSRHRRAGGHSLNSGYPRHHQLCSLTSRAMPAIACSQDAPALNAFVATYSLGRSRDAIQPWTRTWPDCRGLC